MRARLPSAVRVLAAIVVLTTAACTGGDAGSELTVLRTGAVVAPGVAKGAGAKLPDGFRVAEGTTLLGPVKPGGIGLVYRGHPVADLGWQAELDVHGDPVAVMRAYGRQALDRGFVVVGADGERCSSPAAPDCEPVGYRQVLCSPQQHVVESHCSLLLQPATRRGGEQLTLELVRTASRRFGAHGSHLTVAYTRWEHRPGVYEPGPETSVASDRLPADGGVAAPPSPRAGVEPALPGTGRPVFAGGESDVRPIVVEPGSELAVSPWPVESNQPSYGLLMRITGTSRDVAERYRRQLGRTLGNARVNVTRVGGRGATLYRVSGGNDGGDGYSLLIADWGPDERWGWLTTFYD